MNHSPSFLRLVENAKKQVKEVTVSDALQLAKDGAALIDVREESEWLAGHPVGAMHISKGVLERDIEQRVTETNRMILCFCGGGYRSALAAENLQRMGYSRVYSVEGGWRAWLDARLPTSKGPEIYPRSPHERLGGLVHLPRLIDKCKLVPTGRLPGYNYLTAGFDKQLLEFICIDGASFEKVAQESSTDEEVLNWLKVRLGPGWPSENLISEFNERLKLMRPATSDKQEIFERARAAMTPTRRKVETYFDLIDLDEGRFVD